MKDLTPDQLDWIRTLDEAIRHAPKYEGEVYRSLDSSMIKDLDKFWRDHQPGKLVTYWGYTSSGTEIYDEDLDIQMRILSKTGADFRDLNPDELEILFGRKARCLVDKVEDNEIWMIEM
jgi:hypothetical protein